MCAGVQKVSRPIDICQEMSQTPPTSAEETAMVTAQTYHGAIDAWPAASLAVASSALGGQGAAPLPGRLISWGIRDLGARFIGCSHRVRPAPRIDDFLHPNAEGPRGIL